MIIRKQICAHNQLDTFAQDRWDEVGDLVKHILDNNKEDAFEEYVSKKFPNGCDEEEFESFCCENQREILDNL